MLGSAWPNGFKVLLLLLLLLLLPQDLTLRSCSSWGINYVIIMAPFDVVKLSFCFCVWFFNFVISIISQSIYKQKFIYIYFFIFNTCLFLSPVKKKLPIVQIYWQSPTLKLFEKVSSHYLYPFPKKIWRNIFNKKWETL